MTVNRKKVIRIVLTILVVIVAAFYLYYTAGGPSDETPQGQEPGESGIQQAVARLGSLTVSVTGSGELLPAAASELRFQENGQLVEMRVKVGDEVKAGQVLARMQIDKTPAEHAAEIASAELAVVRVQQDLEQIYSNAQMEAAQALAAVEEAQLALEELTDFELEQALTLQAVAEAEATLEDAEIILYLVNSSPSQDAIYTAYASLLFKEKELIELQDQIEKTEHEIKTAPNSAVRDRLKGQLLNLQVKLAQQKIEVENARDKYNSLDDPAEPIDTSVAEAQLSTAQAQLAQAKENWEEAQTGPKTGDLAMAEAELAQAQAEWERLIDGPDPDEIALAEAQLAQAQAKLALVRQEQLILDLVAPMDGTVASINAVVGDRITSQTILTLVDSSQPSVEVYLDETDLVNVQVGYKAEVGFEALPEVTFNGQIAEVDPSLIRVSGTYALRALVHLDATPSDKPQTLPMGLNATVEIIAGQVNNAVLVPVEAVHELSSGEYAVYVVQGEELELREVSLGLMDLTSAEILSGLAAGETVAIGELETLEGTP